MDRIASWVLTVLFIGSMLVSSSLVYYRYVINDDLVILQQEGGPTIEEE